MGKFSKGYALALTVAIAAGGPEALSDDPKGTPALTETMWGIGRNQHAVAVNAGECALRRGGRLWLSDGVLKYIGRDNTSGVGTECPDGSIIDPSSVDPKTQAKIYGEAVEELQAAVNSGSQEPFAVEGSFIEPINTDRLPFAQGGESCRLAPESVVHRLGSLSEGEIVATVAQAPDNDYSCPPGTTFLANANGVPIGY